MSPSLPGHTDRRNFLVGAAALGTSVLIPGCRKTTPEETPDPDNAVKPYTGERYKIGVCDWMILRRQKIGAFERARQIGADGVEVDMGSLGDRETFASKLGDPEISRAFLEEAAKSRLEICSIAMSGFYAQSFAERPTVDRMVGDTFATMKTMGAKVTFLPLGPNNLATRPEIRPAVVARLREYGKQAEELGLTIGIETHLDAAGEVALLEEIGSPAVKIYFNFTNPTKAGRDVSSELRILGRDRICQIHATREDEHLLEEDPLLDMPAIRRTLDEIGWSGWLVLERSRDKSYSKDSDVVPMFGANARYLKSLFQDA